MVTRERLKVTLYIRCLSFYLWDTQGKKCCFPVQRCKTVELLVILGEEIRSRLTVTIMVVVMMMMMCYSMSWRVIFFCGVVCIGVNGPCTETALAVSKWDRI